MKKKYLLLLLPLLAFSVAFISCSGTTTITKVVDKSKIAPPDWIQGVWVLKLSTDSGFYYRFTSDDILFKESSEEDYQSLKSSIALAKGKIILTTDTSTDTAYKVTVEDNIKKATTVLSVTKVSATEIKIGAVFYTKKK